MAESVTVGRPTGSMRRVLVPLALAQFICSFAGSNMNVMINDISRDLDTTVRGVQTAITIFLLVMAALMIPCGKLTDRLGRKRCFTIGLTVYGVGALMSAVSPGLGVLILGNSILEGVGTALLIPPVYILTTMLFDETTSRARAFGVISGMGGIGAAAGPLLGGLITTAISWRAAFVFQALMVAAIVILSRHIQDPVPPDPTRPFDTVGAILSAAGLVALVTGILQADNNLWLMTILITVGALLLFWFFRHVHAMELKDEEPLLSTSLFGNRTSNLGLITQNVQWLILIGTAFVVSAYLQVVRGYNAIQTGVIFTAATAGILISSLAAERLAKRHPQRSLILAGFITTLCGVVVLLALVKGSPSPWAFAPGLLLVGLGVGVMLTPSVNVVQSSFPDEQQGEISGLSRSVSNLGSCLGTAVAGTILVAGLVDWSYALAMISLAIVGVIGLVAALFLPASPVAQGVGGSPPDRISIVSDTRLAASTGLEALDVAAPYARDAAAVISELGSDPSDGLTAAEAASRLTRYGSNQITAEKPPSVWAVALQQLRDPMNLMLVAVTVVSLLIGEVSTGVIVGLLIVLNVVLGSRQELKARASVDALSQMQVPQAKLVRGGVLVEVPAVDVVPGDIVELEAGDIVPADGRIVRSATLEAQEAALTGESAPVAKDAGVLPSGDVAPGDRANMLFQNTSVTRGTASVVVTATGMGTQMGQIATMLTSVTRTRSPLQRELDSLTKVLGIIAWTAVAFIVVVGLARGMARDQVLLLGTAMAISAIPTGLPAFVSGLLSMGAKELADSKAVVKNLTDVETLGATSAINTDKTGTLTMNEMMVSTMYADGSWFSVRGDGYAKTGAVTSVAGSPVPDFTRLALGLALDTDATVGDTGTVVGDPTEAALVVLAAKLGVDAEETRRAYPRLAEVPFDSEYKFMATFHKMPVEGVDRVVQLVKGGPDVVLARCVQSGGPLSDAPVPMEQARGEIDAANARMGQKGLRVLAFAARFVEDEETQPMRDDPMSLVDNLHFVGMVGIIDPLRASSKTAVQTALKAGIDVRMITGDHAVTAQAIGETLGLGRGAISGPELRALGDDDLKRRLPDLHVFGRVTPQDKLRLARSMQEQGLVVAMTGDAVNDAAALKQADIGVAMGSGSEVTKQAARMILTDDNFGTLVHAVELGRRVYDKIVSYIRYQMTQLLALVMLFVAATAFNINKGVALTPSMVLFLLFFATAAGVVVIAVDPGDPDVMSRPPRDPSLTITNRSAITLWILYGLVLFLAALTPLVVGLDEPSTVQASASMTMTFVVMGLGTVFNALTNRRDPTSGLTAPILKALAIAVIPIVMIFLATELPRFQMALLTVSLTGGQWLAASALALLLPIVIEVSKWTRRRRAPETTVIDTQHAVAPARALPDSTP